MRSLVTIAALLAATGCNAVFGLDPVGHGGDDDPTDAAADAVVDDDAAIDAAAACVDPGGQPDEDGDGRRDACDNCPQFYQNQQTDADLDGVGDFCDPHAGPHDRLVAFYGFADGAMPPPFVFVSTAGPGTWTISGGQLRLTGSVLRHDYLARLDVDLRDVTVYAQAHLAAPLPAATNNSSRSVGVWVDIDLASRFPEFPTGVVVETAESTSPDGVSTQFAHLVGVHVLDENDTTTNHPEFFLPALPYGLSLSCSATAAQCTGFVTYPGAGYGLQLLPATTRTGSVGLRVYGVDAQFDYIAIYTPD